MLLLLSAAGCDTSQPYVSAERLERGLVIVLPGIEGRSQFSRDICRGLDEAGLDCAIQLYDWTIPLGPLYNLRAATRNRRQAEYVAGLIVRYRKACPGRPVVLVGQSGGGAIAVWAAEVLPPGQKVDGIILLAAALSPNYMLDMALANSTRGIASFHSDRDWLLLTTNITGTMDGEATTSAGRTGFYVPEGPGKPKCYAALHQVPWDRQMARSGHTGGHLTSGATHFVTLYVAPLVQQDTWDQAAVDRIMSNANGHGPPSASASPSRPGNAERPAPPAPSAPVPSPAPRPSPSAKPPPWD